jgi:hypothetical protein
MTPKYLWPIHVGWVPLCPAINASQLWLHGRRLLCLLWAILQKGFAPWSFSAGNFRRTRTVVLSSKFISLLLLWLQGSRTGPGLQIIAGANNLASLPARSMESVGRVRPSSWFGRSAFHVSIHHLIFINIIGKAFTISTNKYSKFST